VERTHSREQSALIQGPAPVLAAFEAGVAAICLLAAQFDDASWGAQTPLPEWRAFELAGHLRCFADDLHEYLDEAPVSRYARLMATGAHPDTLRRKLTRQHAAELAALADAPPEEHIEVFAVSARSYAARVSAVWDLPHHQYRERVVTVGGMTGGAAAQWHLNAFDLAQALGNDYSPADPGAVLAGWQAGMPHLPIGTGMPGAKAVRHLDPWHAVLAASGRLARAGQDDAVVPSWLLRAVWPARLRLRRKG